MGKKSKCSSSSNILNVKTKNPNKKVSIDDTKLNDESINNEIDQVRVTRKNVKIFDEKSKIEDILVDDSKSRKRKNKNLNTEDQSKVTEHIKINTKKKTKRSKPDEDDVIEVAISVKETKNEKKKRETLSSTNDTEPNKTIATIKTKKKKVTKSNSDDDTDNLKESNKDIKTKNVKFLNNEEAQVKDEDIDQFCDELNEEDNVQYENWIKLLEAKLHPKKT